MKLTLLRNDRNVPAGHLERVARERRVTIDLVRLDAGDDFPDVDDVEAVGVLGGAMGAYDTDRFAYLVAEKGWLATAVGEGVPILGLCLGCQVLADALGGSAHLADIPEVAFEPLDVLTDDVVVRNLATAPSLAMHRDTWTLPPGGRLIARTSRYPQAFRFGSALGIQTHPEVTPAIVKRWIEDPSSEALVRAAGVTGGQVLEWIVGEASAIASTADSLFGAWLDEAAVER